MHHATSSAETGAGIHTASCAGFGAGVSTVHKPAAHLNRLFGDLPFLDRFDAAAQAGYGRVEFMFPYSYPVEQIAHRLCSHGLQVVRFCLPAGDWMGGERGIACHPDRMGEFRYGLEEAIRYARPLGTRQLRCLAGLLLPGLAPDLARQTLVNNLRYAAAALKPHGIALQIAPHSVADAACAASMVSAASIISGARAPHPSSPPGAPGAPGPCDAADHFLTGRAQALAVIRDTGSDNLFLQDDPT